MSTVDKGMGMWVCLSVDTVFIEMIDYLMLEWFTHIHEVIVEGLLFLASPFC